MANKNLEICYINGVASFFDKSICKATTDTSAADRAAFLDLTQDSCEISCSNYANANDKTKSDGQPISQSHHCEALGLSTVNNGFAIHHSTTETVSAHSISSNTPKFRGPVVSFTPALQILQIFSSNDGEAITTSRSSMEGWDVQQLYSTEKGLGQAVPIHRPNMDAACCSDEETESRVVGASPSGDPVLQQTTYSMSSIGTYDIANIHIDPSVTGGCGVERRGMARSNEFDVTDDLPTNTDVSKEFWNLSSLLIYSRPYLSITRNFKTLVTTGYSLERIMAFVDSSRYNLEVLQIKSVLENFKDRYLKGKSTSQIYYVSSLLINPVLGVSIDLNGVKYYGQVHTVYPPKYSTDVAARNANKPDAEGAEQGAPRPIDIDEPHQIYGDSKAPVKEVNARDDPFSYCYWVLITDLERDKSDKNKSGKPSNDSEMVGGLMEVQSETVSHSQSLFFVVSSEIVWIATRTVQPAIAQRYGVISIKQPDPTTQAFPFNHIPGVFESFLMSWNILVVNGQPLPAAMSDTKNNWGHVPLRHAQGCDGWEEALIGCLKDRLFSNREILTKLLLTFQTFPPQIMIRIEDDRKIQKSASKSKELRQKVQLTHSKQREAARAKQASFKHMAEHRRLDEGNFRKLFGGVRVKPMGKDRFYNRIWWLGGLGSSNLSGSGGAAQYGAGRIFIWQGLSDFDLALMMRCTGDEAPVQMRLLEEEGQEGMEELDEFLTWLNPKGHRE
ncbi:hypothetical protein C8R42DRAFT_637818 [Lentinula raphanica]|nr:hypothetical protein C8R42DRAFT_637818 [Lentinula raphanica]